MRIATLLDDRGSEHKGLETEHGLSFFIEARSGRYLFDFGSTGIALDNAAAMDIDLSDTDYAICSHGHYDHAGGYPAFVEEGLSCPLVTGKGFFTGKYALNGQVATYLGTSFNEDYLKENGIVHMVCEDTLALGEGAWVMTGFKRTHAFETIPGRFVLREGNTWKPDRFDDEVCLVLDEGDGLVVVVGCSHPGIMNILCSVHERFHKPIKTVVGGTHLMEADETRLGRTLREMETLGVSLIGCNHCSGDLIDNAITSFPALTQGRLRTGDCLFL